MSYPDAIDPSRIGTYPAAVHASGGCVWDAVLEYRVRVDDEVDYFSALAAYAKAPKFHRKTRGSEEPLALVLQRQYIDEPRSGRYVHVKKRQLAEWPVEFLHRPRRTRKTIPDFFAPNAPANRLDIIRGLAERPGA